MKAPTIVALLTASLSLLVGLTASAHHTESRLSAALQGQAGKMSGQTKGSLITKQGEILGALKDFVVDSATGRIVDIVTTLPDQASSHDQLVVIPWHVTQWDAVPRTFVFVGDEAVLQKAPRVARELWRHQPVAHWTTAAHHYWQGKGTQGSSRSDDSHSALYKVSDLIGVPVHSGDGMDLGTIAEVGLHPEDGRIAYAVVFCRNLPGRSSPTLFRLPWDVLHLNPRQRTVVATIAPRTDV
jgi:sporulation protein YlmC with PRC-barrel domain